MGRAAGAAGLRRGPRRSRAAAAGRRAGSGCRPVLEGLHPRHGAGVPQADDRPARDLHAADLAGPDRWGEVLRAPARRDHRPPAPGRDRRGQRRRVPGAPDGGQAVRPDRVVQSTRGARVGRPTALLRVADGRPLRVGRLRGRVRPDPSRDVGGIRRLDLRAGRAAPARARVHARFGDAEPLRLPRSGRLHRPSSARFDLAPPRLVRPGDRCRLRSARGRRRAANGLRADLPVPGLAWQRRRRADAATRGGARGYTAPVHRVERAAARRLRARPEHVGCRVPAADVDRPVRRSRDHPRRQQHDDRGLPLRQADDRPLGFGVRLRTYAFADADLRGAIDRLLGDGALRDRMAGIGTQIRARDGVARAADAIESVGLASR